MTWEPQLSTQITSSDGEPNVYVSYDVGFESIVDEPVVLTDFNASDLSLHGEAAVNIQVYSKTNQMGFRYFRGEDFDIGFATDSSGQTVTRISRSGAIARWIVPRDPVRGFVFSDADIVTMVAVPEDSKLYEDYATVTLDAEISALELYTGTNNQTAIFTAVPSATDTHHGIDAKTVSTTAVPSASDQQSHTYTDAATATEVSVPSATEQYILSTVGTKDTTGMSFWNEGMPLDPYDGDDNNESTADMTYWNAGVPIAPHNS